jgi:transposase
LTAVIETKSHLYLSARVTRGPSQDAPHLIPAARDAVRNTPIDTLLADAAYDSEDNHATPREELGIRSTVIPLNWRGSRKWPQTRYRRQMVRRFRPKPRGSRHKRVYGQRWQAESGFSRSKRLLGSALRATKWTNQKKEILLRVITHNLMLLVAS